MRRTDLERALVESLDEQVDKGLPPRSLVGGVLSQLEDRARPKWWRRLVPRTRLAWALAAAVLALIGGTAYATTSLILEHMRPFAPSVVYAGLVTRLDLSQTIDGVTVKLEAGYADANTVLLGYTITGRNARYDAPTRRLSVVGGPELNGTVGTGYVPTLEQLGWLPSETTIVMVYDGSAVQGAPSDLNLRFETSVSESPMADEGQAWGPFVFTFTLPFHGGETIAVGQTVEAAGVPITLEKVLVSPAGTKAVFSFYGDYEDIHNRPVMVSSLGVPGAAGKIPTSVNASMGSLADASSVDYYPGDFTDRTGEWTVTIKELVIIPARSPGAHKASETIRIAGPWVFRFAVP